MTSVLGLGMGAARLSAVAQALASCCFLALMMEKS